MKKPFAMYSNSDNSRSIFYFMFIDCVIRESGKHLGDPQNIKVRLENMGGEHTKNLSNGYNMVVATYTNSYTRRETEKPQTLGTIHFD
jgi:hypothetical protein